MPTEQTIATISSDIENKRDNQGFIGMSIGGLVGGVAGFIVTPHVDGAFSMLPAISGMVIGGYIGRLISNIKKDNVKKIEDNAQKMLIGGKTFFSYKAKDTAQKEFNKRFDQIFNFVIQNPEIAFTTIYAQFNYINNQVAILSSHINVAQATNSAYTSASILAKTAATIVNTPLFLEVAAASAVIGVAGYVAYSYFNQKKNKSSDIASVDSKLETRELERAEIKLKSDIEKLDQLLDKADNTRFENCRNRMREDLTKGVINYATIQEISRIYIEGMQTKNPKELKTIMQLSDEIFKSILQCNRLSHPDKSFAKKVEQQQHVFGSRVKQQ